MGKRKKREAVIELWEVKPTTLNPNEHKLRKLVERYKSVAYGDGIHIRFYVDMQELVAYPQLAWLSEYFGTKNIRFEPEYEEVCPTCGGDMYLDVYIFDITQNNPFNEQETK